MSESEPASPAAGAAGIRAIAAEFHGAALDDARAEAIAAELARLRHGMKAAGPAPADAAPGAAFRSVLLAGAAQGPRRA